MKKIVAILLSIVLVLGITTVAFAEDTAASTEAPTFSDLLVQIFEFVNLCVKVYPPIVFEFLISLFGSLGSLQA